MQPRSANILAAVRTPIGRYLGGLSSLSAVALGQAAAQAAIERARVSPSDIEETIVGHVLTAGTGQAPARQVALGAGLPETSSALTINMVCGSGLRAVMLASNLVTSGEAGLVLAGGMESMSNAPHLLRNGRSGWKIGDAVLVDHMMHDGLVCACEKWPMGMAAEHTAAETKLTRAEIDAFALESHRRALAAQEAGAFQNEIVPIRIPGKKGETVVAADEGPRADTTATVLAKLSPSFKPDGIVTAGNSSQLSDGAAMLVVASDDAVKAQSLAPVARVVAWATAGRAPRDLFLAPIDAVKRVLERAKLVARDIDLFELNEAFAAQAVADMRGLELDPAKVNVNGGATALGHPIGASGARVLTTLIHALRHRGARFGCAALCLGGGNAVAMIVERV